MEAAQCLQITRRVASPTGCVGCGDEGERRLKVPGSGLLENFHRRQAEVTIQADGIRTSPMNGRKNRIERIARGEVLNSASAVTPSRDPTGVRPGLIGRCLLWVNA